MHVKEDQQPMEEGSVRSTSFVSIRSAINDEVDRANERTSGFFFLSLFLSSLFFSSSSFFFRSFKRFTLRSFRWTEIEVGRERKKEGRRGTTNNKKEKKGGLKGKDAVSGISSI